MEFYEDPERDFSFDERVSMLAARGMVVEPNDIEWLRRTGYYRVKPYWRSYLKAEYGADGKRLPMRKSGPFKENANFSFVKANYLTDAKLRHKLFPGLEVVEIAFREATSDVLQKHFGRYALYTEGLTTRFNEKATDWAEVMKDCLIEASEKKNEGELRAVFDYTKRKGFDNKWPIWQGVEVVTFGKLQAFHSTLTDADIRLEIAQRLGYEDADIFCSAMRQLNILRNRCAHHSRIFNHEFIRSYTIPEFLNEDIPPATLRGQIMPEVKKTYALLTVLVDMNLKIDPSSVWARDMLQWLSSPQVSEFFLVGAGFPSDWTSRPVWVKAARGAKAA